MGGTLKAVLVCLLVFFGHTTAHPAHGNRKASVCGYESCAAVDPNKLNVHLIPHTHDDVGWLKTVDQYYYGNRNNIQNAGVQYILDSVVDALRNDPKRKFIYVETAFFMKWWVEQSEETQQLVKDLVNEGRLEFIGGGWSMNDEAASHYYSIIDQFTWGLRKLNDTFGACGRPHIGWQIDPFGHSREMASIFAQMGFDGLFIARLDYQDKNVRLQTKTGEMIWEGSVNLGTSSDLFTSVTFNNYAPPAGFCFDILCNDTPFIDNPKSPDYNVKDKVSDFIAYAKKQALNYTTNNILITMGEDFYYQDALTWFKNLDKLIKYTNEADSSVNLIYSTPSCYLKAVNDAQQTYSTKEDDFFPYAVDPNSYWTGYFTSRPTSKYFERLGNNFLQVAKQLEAMTQLGQTGASPLDELKEAMGIMQHHDAITGTEKQHVAEDYARILAGSMEEALQQANTALNSLVAGEKPLEFKNCLELNVSKCVTSENETGKFIVTVYNPLSYSVDHTVRIPADGTFRVQDPQGAEQTIQLVPLPEGVLNLPERKASGVTHDLVFRATKVPAMGFKSYYVEKVSSEVEPVTPSNDLTIGDSKIQISLDEGTGIVKSVTSNGQEIQLDQKYYYYEGFSGNNAEPKNRSSGAYIFRPVNTEPKQISGSAQFKVYKGDVVDEIHQVFNPWVSQVVRIYKGENHAEFEWLVGPIPIEDGVGKEIVSRFTTQLETNGLFYTDSNGRELLERKRNFRPTWELEVNEPVAGNYYPVTSRILIRDQNKKQEVSVLNDRAQGGSSINDGEVELMVHRRLLYDDRFGVGEALNETAYGKGLIARGKHFLMAGSTDGPSPTLAAQERILALKKLLSPWLFFSATGLSFEDWQKSYKTEFSGLLKELPENVIVHTLEPWKEDTLLLRLEHILEKNEDPQLSKPVELEYQDIFSTFTIESSHETTLAGNQWIEDMNRLVWKKSSKSSSEEVTKKTTKEGRSVTLNPMQIGTYVIRVNKR